MRPLLATLLFCCAASSGAQDTVRRVPAFRHEITLDVTGLVPYFNADSWTGNYGPNYPYYLNYRYHLTGCAIRYGVGVYGGSSSNEGDGIQDHSTASVIVQQRLGVERWNALAPRWALGGGIDLVHRYEEVRSKWEFTDGSTDDRTDIGSGRGGGLVLGLRFKLIERLWLGTETHWYLMATTTRHDKTFSSDPTYDEHYTERSLRSEFQYPVNVLVTVRF